MVGFCLFGVCVCFVLFVCFCLFAPSIASNYCLVNVHQPKSLQLLSLLCVTILLGEGNDTSSLVTLSQDINEVFEKEHKSFQVTWCYLKPRIPSSAKDQSGCLKARQRRYFGQQAGVQEERS